MDIINRILLKIKPDKIIRNSKYFDSDWYKEKYDIDIDPANHYLDIGWKENYNPSRLFSTRDYLINNPDIIGINPLLHYEVFGKNEGRKPFVPPIETIGDYSVDEIDFNCHDYFTKIDNKELISFDVFDTLVVRPFLNPADLFIYMENKYNISGFAKDRIDAERKARSTLNKEVTLDDVYDYISKEYIDYKQIEIDEEIRLCHCNRTIKSLYDEAKKLNKRVIATSDMYHSKETISRILNNSGYELDEIYVSCQFNKTKGNGDLYTEVLKLENKQAQDMIHFGDNYLSDYSQAVLLNIEAYNTPTVTDLFLSKPNNKVFTSFLNRHNSLSSSIYLAMMAEKDDTRNYFEKLGYCFGGPLALGYLKFICDNALKDNIDKLLFVARDGYSLIELYKKYLYDSYRIDYAYAYLSRAAIISGSIDNRLSNDLKKLLEIARLEIKDIDVYDTQSENQEEYIRHQKEIDQFSIDRSNNLRKHLETICTGNNRIATVDMVSSRFTSYSGARYYLKDRLLKGYFAGFFSLKKNEFEFYCDRLLGMRDNLPIKLSEILISSYENSIVGTDKEGKPIYEENGDDRKERYQSIIEGMFEYCDDLLKYLEIDNRYIIDFDMWIDLVSSYLNECDDEDLSVLSGVIDSQNPVTGKDDRNFKELIKEFRKNGY